jgi:hypothetical protein
MCLAGQGVVITRDAETVLDVWTLQSQLNNGSWFLLETSEYMCGLEFEWLRGLCFISREIKASVCAMMCAYSQSLSQQGYRYFVHSRAPLSHLSTIDISFLILTHTDYAHWKPAPWFDDRSGPGWWVVAKTFSC